MIDHQVHFRQRIDLFRVAAEVLHGVAHRRQVDHCRHAGQVLHQHARGPKGDFAVGGARLGPIHYRFDVILGDGLAVLKAQEVFQQHPHGIGKLGDALEPALLRRREAEIDIALVADFERLAALETVQALRHGSAFR